MTGHRTTPRSTPCSSVVVGRGVAFAVVGRMLASSGPGSTLKGPTMAPAGFALAKQWAACVVGALFLFPLGAGAADAERGKQLFEQCAACHALGGAPVDMGPSLKGVFGRTAGTLEDFRYSPVMRRSGIV